MPTQSFATAKRMIQTPLKRISFIHTPDAFLAETQQYGAMFMPVWAYTLAAYVEEPENYDLRLFDMRFDAVDDVPPADLFVFSGVNQDYETIMATHGRLRERYPDIDLIVTTGTTTDVVERLLSSGIDLAFTALPVEDDELVATPVRVDAMVAIFKFTYCPIRPEYALALPFSSEQNDHILANNTSAS